MKVILISVCALLFVSCSKKQGESDTWTAPQVYFSRDTDNKTLSDLDELNLNDYVYFANRPKANLTELSTEHTLFVKADCTSGEKTYSFQTTKQRDYLQLREVLPFEPFITSEPSVCQLEVLLTNKTGSTKKYSLKERTVSGIVKADFEFPTEVSHNDFPATTVSDLHPNDLIQLYCEYFSAAHTADATPNASLYQLYMEGINKVENIDAGSYKPVQNCRMIVRSTNQTRISNEFKMKFKALIPRYTYTSGSVKGSTNGLVMASGFLTNPYSTPIAVGFLKRAIQSPARVIFSDNSIITDKGDIQVILLPPNSSLKFEIVLNYVCAGINECGTALPGVAQPLYNLEINYRSQEEIVNAKDVKILGELEQN